MVYMCLFKSILSLRKNKYIFIYVFMLLYFVIFYIIIILILKYTKMFYIKKDSLNKTFLDNTI